MYFHNKAYWLLWCVKILWKKRIVHKLDPNPAIIFLSSYGHLPYKTNSYRFGVFLSFFLLISFETAKQQYLEDRTRLKVKAVCFTSWGGKKKRNI